MTDERTDGAQRGWRGLGKYRVLAMGLHLNPYFTTHHVFLRGVCIGRQLSVPTLDDARWYEATRGEYARPTNRPEGYSAHQVWRRGRLTNAERAKRDETLLDVPVEEAA